MIQLGEIVPLGRAVKNLPILIVCLYFLLLGPAISAAGIHPTIAQPKSVWTAIGPGSPTLGFLISRNICKQTWSMPIRILTNEVSTGGRLRSMR